MYSFNKIFAYSNEATFILFSLFSPKQELIAIIISCLCLVLPEDALHMSPSKKFLLPYNFLSVKSSNKKSEWQKARALIPLTLTLPRITFRGGCAKFSGNATITSASLAEKNPTVEPSHAVIGCDKKRLSGRTHPLSFDISQMRKYACQLILSHWEGCHVRDKHIRGRTGLFFCQVWQASVKWC